VLLYGYLYLGRTAGAALTFFDRYVYLGCSWFFKNTCLPVHIMRSGENDSHSQKVLNGRHFLAVTMLVQHPNSRAVRKLSANS